MISNVKDFGGVRGNFQALRENVPQTPEELKPYRKSGRKEIGRTCLNPQQREFLESSSFPNSFGLPYKPTLQVKDLLPKEAPSGMSEIINQMNEEIYASNKLQPLGKTMNRSYQLPDASRSQNFRYGAPVKPNIKDAKDLITNKQDSPNYNQQPYEPYFKPSYKLDTGEQLNRNYQSSFNPDRKFGVPYVIKPEDMKYILQNLGAQENQSKGSSILSDNAKRSFGPQQLSQSSPNLCLQKSYVSECFSFDNLTPADLETPNLGKSTVFGLRNIPKPGDEQRSFGVPTIRTDASPPKNSSIGNTKNYGNSHDAFQLLRPYKYAQMGISEDDFSKPRTRDEIKDLMVKIGIQYSIGKFFGIFQEAQKIEGTSDSNKVSLSAFIKAMQIFDS